ncbi:MAG TPA: hypothetical protein PKG54_12635 [Phycisphaerae bacterium]|nr:hypothetical protein [Phycisphaerae bacterium]HOB75358.1 hypothetical protein [Phycisphaerae bacterium]HOJ55520.1 hypothetical protein [Phycisphaerae bacterium]HOL26030.1 hypothetical protein [Phycisphaerae bacterium]HPP22550.1 hypothetical protein [Phycisphaerae bacterium]
MQKLSITEIPNELTMDIDVASPVGIVRLLRSTDAQIYSGYRGYPALCDDEIVSKIVQAVQWTASVLGREDSVVIISGAGTSGRLAMFAARAFNRYLRSHQRTPNVRYLIAGGDLALIAAQEGAEDDPLTAISDVNALMEGKRHVLYIGVTCGLSAPYVASQMFHVSRRRGANCILLGFNPADLARDVEIENWNMTFAGALRAVSRRKNFLLLNPVVGPEPVTGSTRMKSGSATKLLLEVIFALAVEKARPNALPERVAACLRGYEQTRLAVYEQTAAIGRLVELGGRVLRANGHIYYVGAGTPGILGTVDASECPPTFGADFETVRGFIAGGWRTLLGPGHDLSHEAPWYRIALEEFNQVKLPTLTSKDLVVGLGLHLDPQVGKALQRSRKAGALTAVVQVGRPLTRRLAVDVAVCVPHLPRTIISGAPVFEEYGTKLILNALTTGGHVLSGKVYQNRMVDLRISNNKLFYRTIGIIQHITGLSADAARRYMLRSIYNTDRITPSMLRAQPSQHVKASTDVPKVVPKALIMAIGRTTLAEAERVLKEEPVVREAIQRLKTARA